MLESSLKQYAHLSEAQKSAIEKTSLILDPKVWRHLNAKTDPQGELRLARDAMLWLVREAHASAIEHCAAHPFWQHWRSDGSHRNKTILNIAASESKDPAWLKMLLSQGLTIEQHSRRYPLALDILRDSDRERARAKMKYLLDHGYNPNQIIFFDAADGNLPKIDVLSLSFFLGHYNICDDLIQHMAHLHGQRRNILNLQSDLVAKNFISHGMSRALNEKKNKNELFSELSRELKKDEQEENKDIRRAALDRFYQNNHFASGMIFESGISFSDQISKSTFHWVEQKKLNMLKEDHSKPEVLTISKTPKLLYTRNIEKALPEWNNISSVELSEFTALYPLSVCDGMTHVKNSWLDLKKNQAEKSMKNVSIMCSMATFIIKR